MSAVFNHPVRILAILIGFGLVMLAGSMGEQQDSAKAVSASGWVTAIVTEVGRDTDPRVLHGRQPLADGTLAKELSVAYRDAERQLDKQASQDRLSDDMILVLYSAEQYLRISSDLYEDVWIGHHNHEAGSQPFDPNESGFQRKVRDRAQWRTNLHEALQQAGLETQARMVTPVAGFTAKLPDPDDPIVRLGGVAAPSSP